MSCENLVALQEIIPEDEDRDAYSCERPDFCFVGYFHQGDFLKDSKIIIKKVITKIMVFDPLLMLLQTFLRKKERRSWLQSKETYLFPIYSPCNASASRILILIPLWYATTKASV